MAIHPASYNNIVPVFAYTQVLFISERELEQMDGELEDVKRKIVQDWYGRDVVMILQVRSSTTSIE